MGSKNKWLPTMERSHSARCEGRLGNEEELVGMEALIPIDGSREQTQEEKG